MNAQNDSRPEWSRIATILILAAVHVALVLIAFLVLFDKCQWLSARIAGLLGLAALGSSAGFFTACQSVMNRGDAKRTGYQGRWSLTRLFWCIYEASHLEVLFRMIVGVSVGGGSYLLVLLASQLQMD